MKSYNLKGIRRQTPKSEEINMGRLAIRVTDREELIIKERAKIQKISVSEYVRRSIFKPLEIGESLRREEERREYKKKYDELLEVLKMIALQMRMGNSLQVEMLRKIAPNEVADIVKRIKESYEKEFEGT